MENQTRHCRDHHGLARLALLSIGAIGTMATVYLLFGPKKEKNQKIAKEWAIKMKDEIIEKLEAASEISKPIFENIIDKVAEDYKDHEEADKDEVKTLAEKLKNNWKSIID